LLVILSMSEIVCFKAFFAAARLLPSTAERISLSALRRRDRY